VSSERCQDEIGSGSRRKQGLQGAPAQDPRMPQFVKTVEVQEPRPDEVTVDDLPWMYTKDRGKSCVQKTCGGWIPQRAIGWVCAWGECPRRHRYEQGGMR
jgi:hypothetical protein